MGVACFVAGANLDLVLERERGGLSIKSQRQLPLVRRSHYGLALRSRHRFRHEQYETLSINSGRLSVPSAPESVRCTRRTPKARRTDRQTNLNIKQSSK